MSIFEDTNPKPLKELLGQIERAEAVLPEFQRDFVWEPGATKELIVSILQNYPAGSLLRIRNAQNLFAVRLFEGAMLPVSGLSPTFLVLDGQQRLTSLYQAFYGKGKYRYYLKIQYLLDGKDINDDCVFWVREKDAAPYDTLEYQAKELILPLAQLKGDIANFTNWVVTIANKRVNPDDPTTVQLAFALQNTLLNNFGRQWIQTVDAYAFPVVTLSEKTGAEAVCNIFETLNRTGVKLTAFELLVARFYPRKVYLRQMWDKAIADYPIIDDFDIDPYYILQVIALSAGRTPSAKRSDVLDLKSEVVNTLWKGAVSAMATALTILRDDCGVLFPVWLPYTTIVSPLAATLAKHPFPAGPQAGAMRRQLVRWFWCSVFSQTYESSPTSQAATDVTQLVAWLEGGQLPDAVANFGHRFNPASLRDTTTRQRAVYRGVTALMLSRHPLDFYTGKPINREFMLTDKVDSHHIFPSAYLKTQGIKGDLADNVLNRTLIGRTTNQKISNKKPSEYFYDIELSLNQAGPNLYTDLLDSHLLPTGDDSPLKKNDYEAFIDWRLNTLWLEIQAVTLDVATATGPVVLNFPQVNQITNVTLRDNLKAAIGKLTEDHVSNGLQEMSVMFEGSLKDYLVARYATNQTGFPAHPAALMLHKLVETYCSLQPEADKPMLMYLKEWRNSVAHPTQATYVPSPAKRREMLTRAPMLGNWFITAIKTFDDQKSQL